MTGLHLDFLSLSFALIARIAGLRGGQFGGAQGGRAAHALGLAPRWSGGKGAEGAWAVLLGAVLLGVVCKVCARN